MRPIVNTEVARVFATYPASVRRKVLELREIILEVAGSIEAVGEIEETLKWGEPAYLTSRSKSGSTIRIAWKESDPTRYAMHFHCQTTLIETFREQFPNDLTFEGSRSIVFTEDDVVPVEPISACVAAALTYHNQGRTTV